MTASDSFSSAVAPPEARRVDLLSAGLLPPLPTAFLGGNDLDLLAPLAFHGAGELPEGPRRPPDRTALASGLATANESYGHPHAAGLAAKLADPATRVVVTGQQPGLFGGPLYTLAKAVAAVRWAERLEAAGGSAVAVFWVATEDHDFREVSRAAFLTAEGPRVFGLGEDEAALLPVGMRSLGPGVGALLDELRAAMPGERFAEWIDTLARWYRPEARFGEAFARLLVHLLGGRAPLVLDAMLPAVKQAERPWLRLLVERRDALEEAFAARDGAIVERGYELQVRPQPGASPLFLLLGQERRRVEWRPGDRMVLRGSDDDGEREVAWLVAAVEENPGVVSPGVLARAPVQDAILGTTLQVLGPGELSYMPQAAPVYQLLEIEAPRVALRPQMLVLEPRQAEQLEAAGLDLTQLVAPGLDLDALVAAGEDEALLAPLRQRLEGLRDELGTAAAVDPSLAGPSQKTLAQIERALDTFGGKLTAAVARRAETSRRRAEKLRAAVRPLDEMQERVVSTAHFPGKYGERFAAACFEQLALDPANLQIVTP